MTKLKHFSFDLWYTLIKSNPAFKKERALYFHKNFNTQRRSIDEVEAVFRSVDLMCNAINEKTGKNIDAEEMYLMVIYQLNNSHVLFGDVDTWMLYNEMEDLLLKYIPSVFNTQTPEALHRIKQDSGNTLNILSNTAFVKGSTLRKIISELDIAQYFDFQIYSDEVGISKPNINVFRILIDEIYTVRKTTDISLQEIIHVGDNPVADINGATAIGINAFQINTNGKLITNLFN